MKRPLPCIVLALAAALCLPGCAKPPPAAVPPPVASANPNIPSKVQPKLDTIKLWIGTEEMVTEMAVTDLQMRTGMMFRTNMAENEGMIFVYDAPFRVSFWMMNTSLPLSAAYIDASGKIIEIHDLQPHDTNSVVAASDNIQYVLETPQGWFKRHNIHEGTIIATEKGSLKKTFMDQ